MQYSNRHQHVPHVVVEHLYMSSFVLLYSGHLQGRDRQASGVVVMVGKGNGAHMVLRSVEYGL